MLYGSDNVTAAAMRSFSGGKLKTSAGEFLANDSSPAIPCQNPPAEHKCYFAGDIRVNQNPGMVALTTSLLRLHNLICEHMAQINPHWDDETMYQEVRRIVWAFIQHVTFKHYLPAVLGEEFVARKGLLNEGNCASFHDRGVNPGVFHEFAAAAFRSYHSQVDRDFIFVDPWFRENGRIRIDDFFRRPSFIERRNSHNELMRGLAIQPSQRMDQHFSTALTNHLFKFNQSFGADLEVLDIMSGRDMGLSRYVDLCLLCGRKRVEGFEDLRDVMTAESIWKLRQLYKSVKDVDLFVGAMMEENLPGASVGPTFQCIIGEQFYNWMRGDRFYYENCGFPWSFTEEQIQAIRRTSLAWLLCVTTDDIDYIQWNTFYLPSSNNPIMSCKHIPHLDLAPWMKVSRSS